MTMFGFGDHNDNELKRGDRALNTRLNYILLGIAAFMFFVAGIAFTERDWFSTAQWFDQIPIRDAGFTSKTLFTIQDNATQMNVSAAGFATSMFFWSAQIISGFIVANIGDWSKTHKSFISFISAWLFEKNESKRPKFSDVSPDKITYFLIWFLVATMDTATDVAWYSSGDEANSVLYALLVSIFLHNFGSEFAIIVGGKYTVISFVNLFRRYKSARASSKPTKPGSNKRESKPQMAARNGNSRPQYNERGNDHHRQQRTRGANMHNDPRGRA